MNNFRHIKIILGILNFFQGYIVDWMGCLNYWKGYINKWEKFMDGVMDFV